MATTFPIGPSHGDDVIVAGKQYVWDNNKKRWELTTLVDTFTNKLPVKLNQNDTVGVGRTIDHSFTIKELFGYEAIT